MNHLGLSDEGGPISRDVLVEAFARVDEKLATAGLKLDVYLFGGASMVFSYGARARTEEVDWGAPTSREVQVILAEVGDELGLPANWIDTQSSRFLPQVTDPGKWTVVDYPNLKVGAASPEHMLGMKLMAARDEDFVDVTFLVEHLGIADRALEVGSAIFEEVWPGEEMSAKARTWLESLRPTAPGDRLRP